MFISYKIGTKFQLLICDDFDFISQKKLNFKSFALLLGCTVQAKYDTHCMVGNFPGANSFGVRKCPQNYFMVPISL